MPAYCKNNGEAGVPSFSEDSEATAIVLKMRQPPGTDGIPADLLKLGGEEIMKIVTLPK